MGGCSAAGLCGSVYDAIATAMTAPGRKEESDRNELTDAEFFIAELASQRLLKHNLLLFSSYKGVKFALPISRIQKLTCSLLTRH